MRRLVTIRGGGSERRRAMMILLFKDTINLINLGMAMTNSGVAGPPQEPGRGGLINLTNKKQEDEHTGWSLSGRKLNVLYMEALSFMLWGGGGCIPLFPMTAEETETSSQTN